MAGALTEATPTTSSFVFHPPAGGDLTLRSCDGKTFQVHSLILGIASTVFSGMLTGVTKSDVVELAEDGETISLMLAFVYPVTLPQITTADQLEKVMLSAQKYDIARMIEFVESYHHPNTQLVLSDPIRVFRASVKHNFPTIQALSAKVFGLSHCNIRSLQGVEELAKLIPESSSTIGLLGAQIIRDKLLSNLLKSNPISIPLRPKGARAHLSSSSNHIYTMACRQCWERSRESHAFDPTYSYLPGWLCHWLPRLHDRLIYKPIDACDDLLSVLYIVDLHGSPSPGCSACVVQTLTKRSLFEEWARDTKKLVDKELEALDKLYTL